MAAEQHVRGEAERDAGVSRALAKRGRMLCPHPLAANPALGLKPVYTSCIPSDMTCRVLRAACLALDLMSQKS